MAQNRRFLVMIAFIVLGACDAADGVRPEGESANGQFDAIVIGVQDCNMVLLEFKEEDVPAIQQITDIESSRYFALILTKVLLDPGQKLIVVIRKLTDEELFTCPTFAPTYPGLYLISYQLNP